MEPITCTFIDTIQFEDESTIYETVPGDVSAKIIVNEKAVERMVESAASPSVLQSIENTRRYISRAWLARFVGCIHNVLYSNLVHMYSLTRH